MPHVDAGPLCGSIRPGDVLVCTDVVTASVTVASRQPRSVYLTTLPTSFYRIIDEAVVPQLSNQARAGAAALLARVSMQLTWMRCPQTATLLPPADDAFRALLCCTCLPVPFPLMLVPVRPDTRCARVPVSADDGFVDVPAQVASLVGEPPVERIGLQYAHVRQLRTRIKRLTRSHG
jgi:hypothetical protein